MKKIVTIVTALCLSLALVGCSISRPVDKSDLETLITEYSTLDSSDYTSDTYNPFQKAYNNAKSVNEAKDASKEDVENAENDLRVARAALKDSPRVVLKKLIDQCAAISSTTYTAESFSALAAALEAAKVTYDNTNATDSDFVKAREDLATAKAALAEKPKPTVSQENALKKAQSYLRYSSFSYTGLISQLEFEQFSHEDATYGADNCGADWFKQAEGSAASYMKYSSFSRGRLIDQLIYEGFTQEQAEHGANSVGL